MAFGNDSLKQLLKPDHLILMKKFLHADKFQMVPVVDIDKTDSALHIDQEMMLAEFKPHNRILGKGSI